MGRVLFLWAENKDFCFLKKQTKTYFCFEKPFHCTSELMLLIYYSKLTTLKLVKSFLE